MAERRRSAHAGDDQNNGGTLSAKKPRDPVVFRRSGNVLKMQPSNNGPKEQGFIL